MCLFERPRAFPSACFRVSLLIPSSTTVATIGASRTQTRVCSRPRSWPRDSGTLVFEGFLFLFSLFCQCGVCRLLRSHSRFGRFWRSIVSNARLEWSASCARVTLLFFGFFFLSLSSVSSATRLRREPCWRWLRPPTPRSKRRG